MSQKNIALTLLLVICFAVLWVGYGQTSQYQASTNEFRKRSFAQAEEQSISLASELNDTMAAQSRVATKLATDLTSGNLKYGYIEFEIKKAFQVDEKLYGLAVAFSPYMFDGKSKLHAPYYRRIDGKITRTTVETSYIYTDSLPASVWYTQGMAGEKDGWYSIYSKVSNEWVIAYSVPFYRTDADGKQTLAGMVVAVNTVNGTIKDHIRSVDLGEEGYASIQNADGTVIYFPNMELTGKPISVGMAGLEESVLHSNLARAMKGESLPPISHKDEKGNASWVFFQPLHAPGWTLITVVPQNIFSMLKEEKIESLINIGMLYALGAALVLLVFMRLDLGTETRVWITSVGMAFILLFSILWIWYVIYNNPTRNGEQKALVNETTVNHGLEELDVMLEQRSLKPAIRIPTGIMIQNMALTNKSTTLSGYLWQQYPGDTPDDAILPPQFIDQVGTVQPRERYRIRENGKVTVGWFFSVEIRQYFDVSKYPLDRSTIKIQMEPSALDRNYVLVPDIEAYEMIGPTQKPGLSGHLQIPGWNVAGSYFSFRKDDYNVDFGDSKSLHKGFVPILTFNVQASRNIVFPIVTYCILIYVVVIQAFGISVIKIEDPFQVLSVAAALFLVVAITHTALRNELASNSAIYLEYYFILLYLAILASSVTALLRAARSTFFLVYYRNNILTKTLFWPSFLGTGLLITLILFHPGVTELISKILD